MGLGLHSAIHIAKMGMGAAEKTINVSGNNLANANTFGYKAERADFSSFLSYTYNYGFPSTAGSQAGTNPLQIGMGVELAGVTTNHTQGSFKEGMTSTDIAINGYGFLVVNGGGPTNYYTRNGSLKINDNFDLTSNGGMYVMGYGINDKFEIQYGGLTNIKVPIGEMHIAEATENVKIEGILDAVGDSGTQGTVLATPQMTDLSKPVPEKNTGTANQLIRPGTENLTKGSGTSSQGGRVEEGAYLYRFVYVEAGTGIQSDYSTPTDAIQVGSGQNGVSLTDLPGAINGSDNHNYQYLQIYRAVDPRVANPNASTDSAEYFLVDTVNAATTKNYVDRKSTAEITDPTSSDYKQLNLDRLSGNYDYYVTYVDGNGNETRPSLLCEDVTLNINGQIELTNLPTDGTQPWVSTRIYRCADNNPTKFYRVGEVPAGTDSFIDRMSDATLANQPAMSWAGGGTFLATASTKLVDLGKYDNGQFYHVFEAGTLSLTPQKGTEELRVANLEITDSTTVSDYLNFLNEAYGILSGEIVDESGNVQIIPEDQGTLAQQISNGKQGAYIVNGALYLIGNSGTNNALTLDDTDMRLTSSSTGKTDPVDLNWLTTQQTAVGSSVSTDLQVYDSLGAPVSVRMTFVLESKSNTETVYRWYADSPDNQASEGNVIATGTGTLTFGSNGQLIDYSSTKVNVQRTQVASTSPLTFDFEMNVNALKAMATTSPEVMQTEQDGAGAGTLYDISIGSDGIIMGIFTSGAHRPLGQLALATFRNQEGLYKAGDSLYQAGTNSGDARIGVPDSGIAGKIKSESLELSNTDIGSEIVDMILASAMYRANAKVMTTSNEMFDAMLRII